MRTARSLRAAALVALLACGLPARRSPGVAGPGSGAGRLVLPVTVPAALPEGPIPIDVEVDFAALVRAAGAEGVFDPNTVEVRNLATGARQPHALSPHVHYGDRARVRWVVRSPDQKRFDLPRRLACYGEDLWGIAKHGPYYGVGDMDGDGRADLIASTETGSYVFFRRTAIDMDRPPAVVLGDVRMEGEPR